MIKVHRDGGFDDDVVLLVSGDYLDLFNRNSIDPQPDSETSTAHNTRCECAAPPTDTFVASVQMECSRDGAENRTPWLGGRVS
jgi:hypothetical protein